MIPLLVGETLQATSKVYLGAEVAAYRVNDDGVLRTEYELYPIFIDDQIVAVAQLLQNDSGAYSVCCSTTWALSMQEYFKDNPYTEISLIFAREGTFIHSATYGNILIYDEKNERLSSIETHSIKKEDIKGNILQKKEALSVAKNMSARSVQFSTLPIPHVDNEISVCTNEECNGLGLCWAACIAMIANYFRGTNFTAQGIHDNTGCYSIATPLERISAMRTVGIYGYGPYNTLTFGTLMSLIQANRPLFLKFGRTDSQGVRDGHAVVGRGYYSSSNTTTKYLYYIDPNDYLLPEEREELEENGTTNFGEFIVSFPTSGDLQIPVNDIQYTFEYYIETSY